MATASVNAGEGRPKSVANDFRASRRWPLRSAGLPIIAIAILGSLPCGCTPLEEYVRNGFEVGPDYGRPAAPVADNWIDAADKRIRTDADDLSRWWTVFNDPALEELVQGAYRQNISLRQAGFQVLLARAQLGIAIGELFPQTQQASGSYTRNAISVETANNQVGNTQVNNGQVARVLKRFYGQWNYGFNLNWELDFWGRYRRAIESADANLDGSVENYDDVLVTLLSDVATNYVNIRTLQERIKLVQANVDLQRKTLEIATARFQGGTATGLDVDQAQSTLSQTAAEIPQLQTQLRQANNQLCILLGIPPQDLTLRFGTADIPRAPGDVAVGIPADLLRRRPDVRHAERQAAAQSAQIGIADSDFYPQIALSGSFGYTAEHFAKLFVPAGFDGTFGPSFNWNLLNYGRILNNVRVQDAQFQSLVAAYQNTVLTAGAEVENGLIAFLKAQEQVADLSDSVNASQKAVNIAVVQYQNGAIDFNRLALLEQNLVQQQDLLTQARGAIDLGLIQVYRALGGGWQIRCTGRQTGGTDTVVPAEPAHLLPPPAQVPAPVKGAAARGQLPEQPAGQSHVRIGMLQAQ